MTSSANANTTGERCSDDNFMRRRWSTNYTPFKELENEIDTLSCNRHDSHCGPDIKSEDYLHLPGNDIEEPLRQSEDVKPIIALATVGLSIEESSRQSPLKGIQAERHSNQSGEEGSCRISGKLLKIRKAGNNKADREYFFTYFSAGSDLALDKPPPDLEWICSGGPKKATKESRNQAHKLGSVFSSMYGGVARYWVYTDRNPSEPWEVYKIDEKFDGFDCPRFLTFGENGLPYWRKGISLELAKKDCL